MQRNPKSSGSHPRRSGTMPATRLRVLVCSVLAVLSAGCQTQAPPARPEMQKQALQSLELPSAWKAGGEASPVADYWLATFGDPQLDALVAEAIAKNPDLRVTATKVEQAGQYVEMAKATLLPAVNLFGTGGTNMGGGDALQLISLGVSWEIDLWGRLRYGRNAAEETYASSRADFEFARQSLAATTAKSWFTASETWLQQQIAEDMVKSSQQLLALAEKRLDVGIGNEKEVALARANLGTFQDSAKQIRLAHGQAIRALEVLLGRYPAAELQARHDLAKLPGPVPAGMPLQSLERRPDLIAAERRVAAAFNRVGEAKAAQLPRLNLNGGPDQFDHLDGCHGFLLKFFPTGVGSPVSLRMWRLQPRLPNCMDRKPVTSSPHAPISYTALICPAGTGSVLGTGFGWAKHDEHFEGGHPSEG